MWGVENSCKGVFWTSQKIIPTIIQPCQWLKILLVGSRGLLNEKSQRMQSTPKRNIRIVGNANEEVNFETRIKPPTAKVYTFCYK